MSLEGLDLRAYHTKALGNAEICYEKSWKILEITIICGLLPKCGCHNHVDRIANQKNLTYEMYLIIFISVS